MKRLIATSIAFAIGAFVASPVMAQDGNAAGTSDARNRSGRNLSTGNPDDASATGMGGGSSSSTSSSSTSSSGTGGRAGQVNSGTTGNSGRASSDGISTDVQGTSATGGPQPSTGARDGSGTTGAPAGATGC